MGLGLGLTPLPTSPFLPSCFKRVVVGGMGMWMGMGLGLGLGIAIPMSAICFFFKQI